MILYRKAIILPVALCLVLGFAGCKPAAVPATDIQSQTELPASGPVVVKVTIRQAGIYAIREQDLVDSGLNPTAVENRPIRLYWRGVSLPVWVDRDF